MQVCRHLARWTLLPVLAAWLALPARGADDPFLAFTFAQADALLKGDTPPDQLNAWKARREKIRAGLLESWGGFPSDPCPLEPKVLGTLERDGYRVEKIVFQTRPGVWMTANAYVPSTPGEHPAILGVHGHWKGAKQDPVVQSRCIGAVKLGFFVLMVDAFGAGERGVGKALGEYHGEMTAATLLPVGLPLSGLQVYENLRAVDYLKTRPEVDADHIGVTGASGGGNQSMYAGAWDDRLKAVVPVCSVGNYRAYLGVACCVCELVPGAITFADEWGVLGQAAPRGLMFVNATRDASQFSVGEAKKTLAALEPIYKLYGKPANVRQTIFESGHDYSRPMREAMYGWMTLHLKGQGDGSPIPEPEFKTEDPETLRCYPGETRPDDYVTIPRFAKAEGEKLLKVVPVPKDGREWREAIAPRLRGNLAERVLGGFPRGGDLRSKLEKASDGAATTIDFDPEPGLSLKARLTPGKTATSPLVILLNLDGAAKAEAGVLASEVRKEGWGLVTLDLRATGALAWKSDKVGRAPDHNTAEWAMWIGRPLLGQWCQDVRRLIDALDGAKLRGEGPTVLIGEGPAGVVALTAAALDTRIAKAATSGTLASYITDTPYEGQRMGILAPGILKHVGDVAQIASLVAPRRVVIAGGVAGSGQALEPNALQSTFAAASRVWSLNQVPEAFTILPGTDAATLIRTLR